MSARTARNLIAVMITVLILMVLPFLVGCGTLGGDGLKLEVKTPEKTVLLDVDYQIENGLRLVRTDEGEYDIELGSATTKDAEFGMITAMMQAMMQMWSMSMGIPMAVPPTPAGSSGDGDG